MENRKHIYNVHRIPAGDKLSLRANMYLSVEELAVLVNVLWDLHHELDRPQETALASLFSAVSDLLEYTSLMDARPGSLQSRTKEAAVRLQSAVAALAEDIRLADYPRELVKPLHQRLYATMNNAITSIEFPFDRNDARSVPREESW